MHFLKISTGVDVRIGPAMAVSDGLTPVTSLNLVAADQAELLKHNGAATIDITGRSISTVTGCDGWYDLTLTTTDTNTVGMMTLVIQDTSLVYPMFKDFMVLPAAVYDSLVNGTDTLPADVTQLGGDTQSGTDLKSFADSGYDPANTRVRSDLVAIGTDAASASNFGASTATIITGAVTATTVGDLIFTTDVGAAYTADDALVGRTIMFAQNTTTLALRGQARGISSYETTNGLITLNAPLSASTANTDSFIIF